MKKADLFFNIFILALSVFTFVEGRGYPYESRGTLGAGFFPVWISAFLFILAFMNTVNIVLSLKKGEDETFFISKTHRMRVTAFLISLFIYIIAVIYIGMIPATFLYTLYIYKIFDKFSWKATLPAAIGLVAFIYLAFVVLLRINLPSGLLFR